MGAAAVAGIVVGRGTHSLAHHLPALPALARARAAASCRPRPPHLSSCPPRRRAAQAGLSRVLTPVQHARILLASYPYLPDIVQFCRWLCTSAVAAPQQMLGGDAPGAFFSGGQAEAEAILDGLFDDEEVDLLASLVTVDAGHLVPLRP